MNLEDIDNKYKLCLNYTKHDLAGFIGEYDTALSQLHRFLNEFHTIGHKRLIENKVYSISGHKKIKEDCIS